MSELLGQEVTKASLDAMTAESKDGYRFPLLWLGPFCKVTGTTKLLEIVAETLGMEIIGPEEAMDIEMIRLRRQLEDLQKRESDLKRKLDIRLKTRR